MSKSVKEIRERLALADQHKATAEAAESVLRKMRLSGDPVFHKGLLGFFKRKSGKDVFYPIEGFEVHALYEAVRAVKAEHEHAAREIEEAVAGNEEEH